jgi:hypothetical protein
MGYRVAVELNCPLPSAVYIAELRSAATVHPTLRVRAQQMARAVKTVLPNIALYYDDSADTWSFQRGNQDIVKVKD